MATLYFPNGPTDTQRLYSKVLRDSVAPEVAARHLEVFAAFDARAILRSVQAPTLVLATSSYGYESASAKVVASLVPDARFLTYEVWGNANPRLEPSADCDELAMGKGFMFGDIGEVVPKGFEEPVRLYEVRWREG